MNNNLLKQYGLLIGTIMFFGLHGLEFIFENSWLFSLGLWYSCVYISQITAKYLTD